MKSAIAASGMMGTYINQL